jgi:hypothetical protein
VSGCLLFALTAPCVVGAQVVAPQPKVGAEGEPSIAVPPPGVLQELELRDGSVLYGRIESAGDPTVIFRTVGNVEVVVQRTDIAAVRTARGRVEGDEFLPADANATRIFFGPTGRALPKGSAYVGVYEFLLPFVQVGITDRLSIGGGTLLLFGLEGSQPFWVTPKLQVYGGERVQVAAGAFHVANVDDGYFGIAYGVATVGDADRAMTVGAGWSYWPRDEAHDSDERSGSAVVMIGGERRISRRLKLLTENYVFRGGGILSAGVRFIGNRLSADLGLACPVGADEVFVFPVVNFVWVF